MNDISMRGGLLEVNPGLAYTIIIVGLAIAIVMIIGMWKVFTKAGEPGWAALVPIYNVYVMVKISGKPMWWMAVMLLGGIIPIGGAIAQIAASIVVGIGTAEKFGKSQGFGVGMGLLGFVFYPILGFSDAQYEGANRASNSDLLDDVV